jgi:hypothetical protein
MIRSDTALAGFLAALRLPCRNGLRFAAVLSFLAAASGGTAAAAAPAVPGTDSPIAVAVVVEGSLPGFRDDELASYIARQMAAAHVAHWRFEPAAPSSRPPERVLWRFKLLPYAGGTVRYIGPAVSGVERMFGVRRAIGVDARLYLRGQFQSTTFDQATIKGGPDDPDLAAVVAKVTRSIVANALAERSDPSGPSLRLPVRALSR